MKTKPLPPPPKIRDIPLEVAKDPEAKLEYVRVVTAIGDRLDARDRSLLIEYALTHSEIIELRDAVSAEGRIMTGEKGGTYINPTVNILISRQTLLASLRRDLYFTPKSRIEKTPKTKSKGQSILESIQDDDES